VKGLVNLDKLNQVIITNRCEAYYPDNDKENAGKIRHGIFAAGDITNTPFKQIVVAAGEGAKAALQAYNCIHGAG
jgi:alkyl hydroperoxide reductase subunit F